jgi:hypothetical protein
MAVRYFVEHESDEWNLCLITSQAIDLSLSLFGSELVSDVEDLYTSSA